MALFYKRLSPLTFDNEWAPHIAVSRSETRWMRVSPGRERREDSGE
jgi:hypothetical protein